MNRRHIALFFIVSFLISIFPAASLSAEGLESPYFSESDAIFNIMAPGDFNGYSEVLNAPAGAVFDWYSDNSNIKIKTDRTLTPEVYYSCSAALSGNIFCKITDLAGVSVTATQHVTFTDPRAFTYLTLGNISLSETELMYGAKTALNNMSSGILNVGLREGWCIADISVRRYTDGLDRCSLATNGSRIEEFGKYGTDITITATNENTNLTQQCRLHINTFDKFTITVGKMSKGTRLVLLSGRTKKITNIYYLKNAAAIIDGRFKNTLQLYNELRHRFSVKGVSYVSKRKNVITLRLPRRGKYMMYWSGACRGCKLVKHQAAGAK